jgi:Histidine kinase-, DNA gyrase B-, and HSP90-like ATPase
MATETAPQGRPTRDPAFYERLISRGIAEADARGSAIDHVTARRLALWLLPRSQEELEFMRGLGHFARTGAVTGDLKKHLQLAVPPEAGNGLVRLDERLAQVVVWYESQVKVATTLVPCLVPSGIAEAFAKAAGEAMENIARYAGTDRAQLELSDEGLTGSGQTVSVRITDHGCGFDTGRASPFGFGVKEDILGRMAAIGGTAAVDSRPGAGTAVSLEWHRD